MAAADAWPLIGPYVHFTDFGEFNARLLRGEPTNHPRMTAVPLRMPLPKALDSSSLYQAQKALAHRAFAVAED